MTRAAYRGRHAGGAYAAASRGGSGTRASRRSSSIRVRAPARNNRSVASRSPARLSSVSCARAASNAARKAVISPSTRSRKRLVDECAAVSRRVRPIILARPSAIENCGTHYRGKLRGPSGFLRRDLRGTEPPSAQRDRRNAGLGRRAFRVSAGLWRLGKAEGGGSAGVHHSARRSPQQARPTARLLQVSRQSDPSAAPLPASDPGCASAVSCVGSNGSCPGSVGCDFTNFGTAGHVRPRRAHRALLRASDRLAGVRRACCLPSP